MKVVQPTKIPSTSPGQETLTFSCDGNEITVSDTSGNTVLANASQAPALQSLIGQALGTEGTGAATRK